MGLLRVEEDPAARVLASFDVTLEGAWAQVRRRVSVGEQPSPEEIPFTPRARQVLELALEKALEMGQDYVGTEHLLLGVAEVDGGVGAEVLGHFDVDGQKICDALIGLGSRAPSRRRRARRGVGRAWVGPGSVRDGSLRIEPGEHVLRVLMSPAARALDDGRTQTTAEDLLIALSEAEQIGPLLAGLGANEAAIRAAFENLGIAAEAPDAADEIAP